MKQIFLKVCTWDYKTRCTTQKITHAQNTHPTCANYLTYSRQPDLCPLSVSRCVTSPVSITSPGAHGAPASSPKVEETLICRAPVRLGSGAYIFASCSFFCSVSAVVPPSQSNISPWRVVRVCVFDKQIIAWFLFIYSGTIFLLTASSPVLQHMIYPRVSFCLFHPCDCKFTLP